MNADELDELETAEVKPGELPDAWDRRADEGARAYRAFETYLALDVDRSVTKVSRKLSVSRTIISRWSAQFAWTERARAFDEHVSKERLARLQSARERLADETLVASRQALALVLKSLGKLKAQRIGAANAARLLAVAIQAQKALFGDEQPLGDQFREIPPVIVMTDVVRHQYDWSKLPLDLQKDLPDYMRPPKPKTDA